jgi:hypothetical protein
MPQSIERVLYTPHRSAAGFLAACVDGRLLCMSLYCRGGATVCSMFDLPADVSRRRQITAATRGPGRASRLPQDRQAMVCQSSPPANGGTSGRNGELCKFAAVRDEDADAVIRRWDRGQRRSNARAPLSIL